MDPAPLDITHEDGPTQNVDSEGKYSFLEKFFQKISEGGDVNVQNVDEWLSADNPEFNTNADSIVQFVLYDFNDTPALEGIEEPEEKIYKFKFFRETAGCNYARVNDGTQSGATSQQKKESMSPNKRF